MPVTLEPPSLSAQEMRRGAVRGARQRIVVGMVNNMPEGSLVATERQFTELLEEAGPEFDIRLRLYALDSIPRSPDAARAMRRKYRSSQILRQTGHDALIVTGAEPAAKSLPEEKFWRELLGVLDIAQTRTRSTVFSCLAAHAAVLHWDSVERISLPRKLSGVFPSRGTQPHPLMDGISKFFWTPHSRFNGLDEAALSEKGYQILARSEAGADIFVKDGDSLLVFLQGHPEYHAHSLLREFRRDLLRYLTGVQDALPDLPAIVLSPDVRVELQRLMDEGRKERRPDLIERFPLAAFEPGDAPWRKDAQRFYRNWLGIVADRQARDRADSFSPAPDRGGSRRIAVSSAEESYAKTMGFSARQ